MPGHCTPVLPWRDSMRVVRCCSSGDLDSVDLPESVRFALGTFLSIPAAERFALLVDARNTSSDTAAVANGVVLLQLQTSPDSLRQAATIHAIGVRENAQDKGIASSLLMRAVDLAVQHGVHDSVPGAPPLACARAGSYVEFFLARGSCLHHWDVMLLLCNHGWCIRRHGQSPSHTSELSPSDIRLHRAVGTSPMLLALTVRGPRISLDGPLLYPGVESGRGLFKAPTELAAPPAAHTPQRKRTRDRWDCSYTINSAILRGTLPLSQLSATYPLPGTGLLPFTAPLLECQKLESYLEDRHNHEYKLELGKDGGNVFEHKLLCPRGKQIMVGYQKYFALNGKHDPALQSARTLKTYSKQSIKDMIERLPGCTGILQAAMARLGHGDLSIEDLTDMVKHTHMLLLDSTSQVDFGWHEDTYDLFVQDGAVRDSMLSVIVQLSATFTTAMQLHGFAYHEYSGQGSGIIFHGRALHRSIPRVRVPPHSAVWKVAFFLDARRLTFGGENRSHTSTPVRY